MTLSKLVTDFVLVVCEMKRTNMELAACAANGLHPKLLMTFLKWKD